MLKLTIAVLAVALAGSASAAGWRSLRVDGSSEASFSTSVEQFKAGLSPARYQVLLQALKDVWDQGTKNAEARQSEYTTEDYLRALDGLAYEQVVTLTDPTGNTAKTRLRNAIARVYNAPRPGFPSSMSYSSGGARNPGMGKDSAGNPNGVPPFEGRWGN